MPRKILAITASRSDYGLMRPIYEEIAIDSEFSLGLIVSGMHLLPIYKKSLDQIKSDHFGRLYLTKKSSDFETEAFLGVIFDKMVEVIKKTKPNIILLQGDRGEMLAAATAAVYHNIPIVHMSGGDYSGTVDDLIRNAVSKLAHIHLASCKLSARRLKKIGESSGRIVVVGEPALDLIAQANFIRPEDLAKEFNLDLTKPIILATQHSVVTEVKKAAWQIDQTLKALDALKIQTIFTYPNNDPGSAEIIKVLKANKRKKFLRLVAYLGSEKYLSLMRIASVVVGNSSSGIIEAPCT